MIKKFYHFKQDRNIPNTMYFEKYQNLLEVLKNQDTDLGCEPGLIKSELNVFDPLVCPCFANRSCAYITNSSPLTFMIHVFNIWVKIVRVNFKCK